MFPVLPINVTSSFRKRWKKELCVYKHFVDKDKTFVPRNQDPDCYYSKKYQRNFNRGKIRDLSKNLKPEWKVPQGRFLR